MTPHQKTLVAAAYEYIGLALGVIALTGKTPNVRVHRHGLKDAIWGDPEGAFAADGDPVERAFYHADTTGIGVLTSNPYIVVDIDGEEGARGWQRLVGDDIEWLPDRWVAQTGRGLHLWFQSVEPTGSMKLGEKLDLKGEGGYVAAPPSRHPDGHEYKWLAAPDERPYMVPLALMQRIREHNADIAGLAVSRAHSKRVRHQPLEDGILYASWGFDHLIEGVTNAADGNRNNYLHWAAATMAEEGALPEEFEQLREAALKAGLTHLEVKRTIRSARAARD